MFPLGSVLFPHMPLPLQLFEERYLKMLGQALESDDPQFGVVLIERGSEVGGDDQRLDFGTLARVVEVDARAGNTGVLSIGTHRIRVHEWLADDPYPQARVERIPELDWSDDLTGLFEESERAVRQLLSVAAEMAAGQARTLWPPTVEIGEDRVTASWQLAAITPLGPMDHYDLLRSQTCEELLQRTGDLSRDATQTAKLIRNLPPPSQPETDL